jgi:hypothetical protein
MESSSATTRWPSLPRNGVLSEKNELAWQAGRSRLLKRSVTGWGPKTTV